MRCFPAAPNAPFYFSHRMLFVSTFYIINWHETAQPCSFVRMAGSSSGAMQRPSTRAPQPLPPPLKRTSSLPSKVAAARRAGQGAPPSAGKRLRPWAPRFDEELFAKGFDQRHVLFLPKNAERNRPIIPIEWQTGQPLPGARRAESGLNGKLVLCCSPKTKPCT